MKSLVQQFYETKAAQDVLNRALDRIKRRLEKRAAGAPKLEAGPFWVRLSHRPECQVPEHTRKACVVWERRCY